MCKLYFFFRHFFSFCYPFSYITTFLLLYGLIVTLYNAFILNLITFNSCKICNHVSWKCLSQTLCSVLEIFVFKQCTLFLDVALLSIFSFGILHKFWYFLFMTHVSHKRAPIEAIFLFKVHHNVVYLWEKKCSDDDIFLHNLWDFEKRNFLLQQWELLNNVTTAYLDNFYS